MPSSDGKPIRWTTRETLCSSMSGKGETGDLATAVLGRCKTLATGESIVLDQTQLTEKDRLAIKLDKGGTSDLAPMPALDLRALILAAVHLELRWTGGKTDPLVDLRDRGQHNHGALSYYTLPHHLTQPTDRGENPTDRGEYPTDRGENPTDRGEYPTDRGEYPTDRGEYPTDRGEYPTDRGEYPTDRGEYPTDRGEYPTGTREALARLGKRPRKAALRAVIAGLCEGRWMSATELARQLGFTPSNLTHRHLSPMVEAGQLERRYADNPTHRDQAYRAVVPPVSQPSLFEVQS